MCVTAVCVAAARVTAAHVTTAHVPVCTYQISWLERESLRHPTVRRHLPKSMRRPSSQRLSELERQVFCPMFMAILCTCAIRTPAETCCRERLPTPPAKAAWVGSLIPLAHRDSREPGPAIAASSSPVGLDIIRLTPTQCVFAFVFAFCMCCFTIGQMRELMGTRDRSITHPDGSDLSDQEYIRNFGYLHGIGLEPEDYYAPRAPQEVDCVLHTSGDGLRKEMWPFPPPLSSSDSSDDEPAAPPPARSVSPPVCPPLPEGLHRFMPSEGLSSDESAPDESDGESDGGGGVGGSEGGSGDGSDSDGESVGGSARRWQARPCDQCVRCGLFGHWASDCPHVLCRNCKQFGHVTAQCPMPVTCFRCRELGHLAADCPVPAGAAVADGPCFRCGLHGHWVADCPMPTPQHVASSAAERRWVLFSPPSNIQQFTHFCSLCKYPAATLTKASKCMPRHKVPGSTPGRMWCPGSGLPPKRSELQSEQPAIGWYWSELGQYDDILDWKVGSHICIPMHARHEGRTYY